MKKLLASAAVLALCWAYPGAAQDQNQPDQGRRHRHDDQQQNQGQSPPQSGNTAPSGGPSDTPNTGGQMTGPGNQGSDMGERETRHHETTNNPPNNGPNNNGAMGNGVQNTQGQNAQGQIGQGQNGQGQNGQGQNGQGQNWQGSERERHDHDHNWSDRNGPGWNGQQNWNGQRNANGQGNWNGQNWNGQQNWRNWQGQGQRYNRPEDWRGYDYWRQSGERPHVDVRMFQRNVFSPRHFHVGFYHPPRGWFRHRWHFGERLPRTFFIRDYWIDDFWDFGLIEPPPGYVWVRVGDDALLVDEFTGEVVEVVYGVFY